MEKDTNDHEMKDAMHYIPMTSIASGKRQEVAQDLFYETIQIVNAVFAGPPDGEWVLVDTGMPETANRIMDAAEERFGSGNQPQAIILTHGHFDHVGGVVDLVEKWNVPVYAHEKEMPYLTGQSSYPEPDGTVEGGLVAKLSPMFPNEPIDLGDHVQPLPSDGVVPGLPGWSWIHTPGHSPGHVSLFRDEDRSLIAGDAFITVKQDSLFKVLTQAKEVNGPPRYYTTDWQAAWDSAKKLQSLDPAVAITGHGLPVSGDELSAGLEKLVQEFDRIAIPDYGRYVDGPES